jgi:hypothetical protein
MIKCQQLRVELACSSVTLERGRVTVPSSESGALESRIDRDSIQRIVR